MKYTATTFTLLVLLSTSSYSQVITRMTEKDSLVMDIRDGQTYETVRYTSVFPDQTSHSIKWMTRNLNFESEDSFCYDNENSNCETYGRLYTWYAAMKACPEGWRMPSDEDWYELSFHFGGNCSSGQALKSNSPLWLNENHRGTNASFFNGLPAGVGGGDSGYFGLGRSAIFWSSTDRDETTTWDWKFRDKSELQRWYGGKMAKHCLRCVQD